MIFVFFRVGFLVFKWSRLIFFLIGLEFLVLRLFFEFCGFLGGLMFLYFLCFGVISRVLGLVVLVGRIKFFGSDLRLF